MNNRQAHNKEGLMYKTNSGNEYPRIGNNYY